MPGLAEQFLLESKAVGFLGNVTSNSKCRICGSDVALDRRLFELVIRFGQRLKGCHVFIQRQVIQSSPFENAR
jgi:hypothetical protein